MHLNKVVLVGRVGERGVTLTYDERSTPTCSFTLEIDEVSQVGKVYTSYLPVEIVGKYAEAAADALDPGDEVLVDGKLKYKKITDKSGQASSKLLISTWQVTKAPTPVLTAPAGRGDA
jgi:single-stranded DNA-binding protein